MLSLPLTFLGWVTDQLFLSVNALFDRVGLPIVFASGLAEATVGVGVVFPGVIIMFLGGAYAAGEPIYLLTVWAVAIGGTAIGDTFSYGLGRWGGRYLEHTRFGPSLRLGSALMRGRGRWFIPFYHLYSVTRAVGPFGAGAVRMPMRSWVPLDYLGAAVANAVWVGAGAIFGTAVLTPDGRLEPHPALRIGLIVVGVLWFLLLRRAAQRGLRELARSSGIDATLAEGTDPLAAGPVARGER
ncbi:MAG: hypothetical protein O3B31_09995 [Chloroflexi bacterium]|nr:hypothetical protein [Chloroflexota bacterium]MDA1003659.1 hypothetical protein [Chloroflexota bacterium]